MNARSMLLIPAALTAMAASATADDATADESVHDSTRRENVVLANAFMIPFGIYNVEYERVVAPQIGITGGLTGFYSNGTPFDSSLRSRGAGLNLGARYYITGKAPTGLFAAAFVRGFHVSVEQTEGMATGFAAGGGAMVGYAHVLFERLHLSAGAGAHVLLGDVAGTHLMPDGYAIDPEIRVALGVAF